MYCAPLVLAAVDDGDDVRVRELRDRARLVAEALDVLVVPGEALVEDLDRDTPLELASYAQKTVDMPPVPTSSSSS